MSTTLTDRLGEASAPTHPQHPDVAQWRPPTEADIDALLALWVTADKVDHPNWLTSRSDVADTFTISTINHEEDSLLGFNAAGELIVYATVWIHPSRDEKLSVWLNGVVHPDVRRRGIGAVVFPWQLQLARHQLAELNLDLPIEIKAYAELTQVDKQRVAEANGLAPERYFTEMERDMADAVPHRDAPAGIRVIEYSPELAIDTMNARNDAFRDHWGSLPSIEESWRQFVDGEFLRPDLCRLAVDDNDRIVAFCLASVNEENWAARGKTSAYIDLIGVVRDHRGEGLAPLVISRALEAIKAEGLQLAELDVDTASPTGANTLYERLGFVPTDRSVALVQRL